MCRIVRYVVAVASLLCAVDHTDGSMTITSISRSVKVDGEGISNFSPGVFNKIIYVPGSIYGSGAQAYIGSDVTPSHFSAHGSAYEGVEGWDRIHEATVLFNVGFQLASPHLFRLSAHAEVPSPESWVTLRGDNGFYAGVDSGVIGEVGMEGNSLDVDGILEPGTYSLDAYANPCECAQGAAWFSLSLSLSPVVPEPASFLIWTLLSGLSLLSIRKR